MSALKDEEIKGFQKKEFQFIDRNLKQHTAVNYVEKIFDRLYDVYRVEKKKLRVMFSHEYEITGEYIRNMRDKFGTFDFLMVKSNPNGKPTSTALEIADELGFSILFWREFLGRLSKP